MFSRTRSVLALVLLALLTIALSGQINHLVPPYSQWDLVAYLHMAEASPNLAADVGAPYAGRLLGPTLAGLGPFPAPEMFRLLTLMTALVLPLLLLRFLTDRGLDETSALTAVALFVCNKQFYAYNVWNYFQLNDLLSLGFLVLLYGAMLRHRWPVFGLILILGAVTKETCLIMIPVAGFYLWEEGLCRTHGWRLLGAVLPAMLLYMGVRHALPDANLGLLDAFRQNCVKAGAWQTWFYLFVNSVLPVSLLPLIFFRRTIAFFRLRRHGLLFLGLVILSAFFGTNNERLMAPVFVVFYWLIGDIISHEFRSGPRGMRVILVGCGFLAAFHHTYTRFTFVPKSLVTGLSLASLVLVSGVSMLVLMRRRRES